MTGSSQDLPPGLRERYRDARLLGAGAMGAVFEAVDASRGRTVAIKLMNAGSRGDPIARFRREATCLARLDHPGLVRLYDFGELDGSPYMVMQRVQGRSLEELLTERPEGVLPAREAVGLLLDVAGALEAVHEAGLVHRDVKPANLVLGSAGRLVLVDFGLVDDPTGPRLTRTGAIVGSPGFLAPEILAGDAATPASDFFSWGASLFMAVEGRTPYSPEAMMGLGAKLFELEIKFERTPADAPVARLLQQVLAHDPSRRPTSRAGLEKVLATTPPGDPLARSSPALVRPRGLPSPAGHGSPEPGVAGSGARARIGTEEVATPPRRTSRSRRRRLLTTLGVAAAAFLLALVWPASWSQRDPGTPPDSGGPTGDPGDGSGQVGQARLATLRSSLEPLLARHRSRDGTLKVLAGEDWAIHRDRLLKAFSEPEEADRWEQVVNGLESWVRAESGALRPGEADPVELALAGGLLDEIAMLLVDRRIVTLASMRRQADGTLLDVFTTSSDDLAGRAPIAVAWNPVQAGRTALAAGRLLHAFVEETVAQSPRSGPYWLTLSTLLASQTSESLTLVAGDRLLATLEAASEVDTLVTTMLGASWSHPWHDVHRGMPCSQHALLSAAYQSGEARIADRAPRGARLAAARSLDLLAVVDAGPDCYPDVTAWADRVEAAIRRSRGELEVDREWVELGGTGALIAGHTNFTLRRRGFDRLPQGRWEGLKASIQTLVIDSRRRSSP